MDRAYFLQRRAARAFGLKDYVKAIDILSELLSVVGENANTLHAVAICHQRLGLHDQAIDFAARGHSSDPAHVGCLEVLAESHVARGDRETATVFARRALEHAETLNTDQGKSANFAAGISAWLNPAGSPTRSRSPSPEWISWANSLVKNHPGVGKT